MIGKGEKLIKNKRQKAKLNLYIKKIQIGKRRKNGQEKKIYSMYGFVALHDNNFGTRIYNLW